MRRYRVVVERDESGVWIVRVPSVPGCHTYGRTLEAAYRRVREALALWVEDADRAHLDFDVHLPVRIRRVVEPLHVARRRAEEAHREAQRALGNAARVLVNAGFSLRDAGAVLGVSHQRVAQVIDLPVRPTTKKSVSIKRHASRRTTPKKPAASAAR